VSLECVHLAQVRDRYWTFVNEVMKLKVPAHLQNKSATETLSSNDRVTTFTD
jgi:hypothetical protein